MITTNPWSFVTQIFTKVIHTNTYLVLLATHINSVSCWFFFHKTSVAWGQVWTQKCAVQKVSVDVNIPLALSTDESQMQTEVLQIQTHIISHAKITMLYMYNVKGVQTFQWCLFTNSISTQIFTKVIHTNTYLVLLATHINSVSCWFFFHKTSVAW
jgi:hypothetical protein